MHPAKFAVVTLPPYPAAHASHAVGAIDDVEYPGLHAVHAAFPAAALKLPAVHAVHPAEFGVLAVPP